MRTVEQDAAARLSNFQIEAFVVIVALAKITDCQLLSQQLDKSESQGSSRPERQINGKVGI